MCVICGHRKWVRLWMHTQTCKYQWFVLTFTDRQAETYNQCFTRVWSSLCCITHFLRKVLSLLLLAVIRQYQNYHLLWFSLEKSVAKQLPAVFDKSSIDWDANHWMADNLLQFNEKKAAASSCHALTDWCTWQGNSGSHWETWCDFCCSFH